MSRFATVVALGLCASPGAHAGAQPAQPQAYTLKARGAFHDREMTLSVVRDGARERVDRTISPNVRMATLYDFAAHRVYWIGWSGAGSCSSGRYLSARAPADDDPVTGAAGSLATLAEGRTREPAGAATIAGLAARGEALRGGKRPAGPDAGPWPTRAWLAAEGGYLLKVEGEKAGGKPITLFEVTSLTFAKPAGAALEPPAGCVATDSEMDESGSIRAHAEASVTAAVSGSVELGAGKGTPAAAAKPGAPAPLARIEGLALSVVPQPSDGPCGAKLLLTASVSVDGPATIRLGFRPMVGGLRLSGGENGLLVAEGAGEATLTKEAEFLRPLKGTIRLQATVQGTKGHDGQMRTSAPVPFEVTCPKR